jgi:hypothetical protein
MSDQASERRMKAMKRTSTVSALVFLALTVAATAGPMSVQPLKLTGPQHAQTELIYYRCPTGYRWFPDGTISGPTAGYPNYGWSGYPYVRYRCVRLHHYRYRYNPHLS